MTQSPNDPHIEIGAVHPDELESLLALICEVFQLPYEPARELFYKDPYLNLENKRVLRVNGQIVSCLTIADREVWLGGGRVRVGGIAGVATHPKERNKGYAGLLLEDTLAYLKTQGYALSALIPYSSHFYRRLGYEICGNVCRYVTAPSYLPTSTDGRKMRSGRPDDVEDLADMYAKFALGKAFHGVRDNPRWHYLLQNVEQCHVYTDDSGKITGYVLSDIRQNPPAFEGEMPMPTLRVLEFVADNPAARRGLLSHLAAQHSVGMVEFCTQGQALAQLGLLDLLGTGIGEEILANIEVVPMLMVRIVDFRVLIATLAFSTHFSGGLRLELHDPTRKMPPEQWTVMKKSGLAPVTASVSSDAALPCLSADVRVWAQVVTGFKGADDAIAQGLLFASDETAQNCGSELFPTNHPFLPIPDHF